MRPLIGLLLFANLLLIGCISEEAQNAASHAANAIPAGNVKLETYSTHDTGKEDYKAYKLVFGGIDKSLFEAKDYDRIASLGAYVFAANLKPTDLGGYKKVDVQLNLPDNITHNATFDMDRLLGTAKHIEYTEKIFDAIKKKDFALYRDLVKTLQEEEVAIASEFDTMMRLDSLNGGFERLNFSGFIYSVNPEDSSNETTIRCQLLQTNHYADRTYRYSDKSGELRYIGADAK